MEKQKSAKPIKPGLGIPAEEPRARRRSPSPARNAVTCIVHVIGLVRPYTLGQLKELLNRTGSVTEDGFWIDKIKSHCYAIVSEYTIEKCFRTLYEVVLLYLPLNISNFLLVV